MFGEKILDYWDDKMKDLGDIIAIPSVAQPQDGPYPFGKDAATAVDKAIEIAERYGIKTKNSDYYAMHAELGEGEENAVVMAHLDVVPAGEGWDSDPYTMVVRDGKAFGRGVSDNKGPAIVALHCLRALKEAGVVGKRKLRVVLGSAEEIGMQDMGHYFRVAADNRDLNYDKFVVKGEVHTMADESYTSHNTERLDVEGTVKKILTTEYVQNALKGIPNV